MANLVPIFSGEKINSASRSATAFGKSPKFGTFKDFLIRVRDGPKLRWSFRGDLSPIVNWAWHIPHREFPFPAGLGGKIIREEKKFFRWSRASHTPFFYHPLGPGG